MIEQHLIPDPFSQRIFLEILILEIELKWRRSGRLHTRIVQHGKVRMLKSFMDSDPLARIEDEHFVDQLDSKRICTGGRDGLGRLGA